jgi:hypothetical protein
MSSAPSRLGRLYITVRELPGGRSEVETIEEDGWHGGSAFFNNPNLVPELAKRRSITVIGPRGRTFEVDLAGSSKAIDLMQACQKEQK